MPRKKELPVPDSGEQDEASKTEEASERKLERARELITQTIEQQEEDKYHKRHFVFHTHN